MNVLVVEDDRETAEAVSRIVREQQLEPHLAMTVGNAMDLLPELTNLSGAILDICLPDGTGLDVLRCVREVHPDLPILMLTGMLTPQLINQVAELGAQYALKPVDPDLITALLKRWDEQRPSMPDMENAVKEAAQRYGLTPRETEILELHTRGRSRVAVIDELGVAPKTYANHVTNLLHKADANSMSNLVIRLLLDAVGSAAPQASSS